jgi:hypothetical protein
MVNDNIDTLEQNDVNESVRDLGSRPVSWVGGVAAIVLSVLPLLADGEIAVAGAVPVPSLLEEQAELPTDTA